MDVGGLAIDLLYQATNHDYDYAHDDCTPILTGPL